MSLPVISWHSAVRSLLRRPAYIVTSVIVLSVSIAAQLMITSVVDATLVRPPSGRKTAELVFVRSSAGRGDVSFPDAKDIRDGNSCFAATFAYQASARTVNLAVGDDMTAAAYGFVSGDFFNVLGVAAKEGRLIGPGDDVSGGAPVAVISSQLQRKLNLSVGAIVKINTKPFEIIGVLPPNFEAIDRHTRPDVWLPTYQVATVLKATNLTSRSLQWLTVGGRLKPGVSFASANAEVSVIGQRLQREYPKDNFGVTLRLEPLLQFRLGRDGSSRTMLMLFGVVWFLFALAFTNFFALTLLRLFTRGRELSIRLALGARRMDIGRWLLGELLVIAIVSLGCGIGLSFLFVRALQLDAKIAAVVNTAGVHIDGRAMLAVLLAVAVCIAVVWFLALRHACRADLVSAIRETGSAPKRQRAFGLLFAMQFALAFFLLSMAVAFVGTLRDISNRKFIFRSENLLLMEVDARAAGQAVDKVAFFNRIVDRLQQVSGVTSVAAASRPPLGGSGWTNLIVGERDPSEEADKNFSYYSLITPRYFETIDVRLVDGRTLDQHDIQAQSDVALIDRAAVDRFWPQGALGKTFRPSPNSRPLTVIGVVDNIPVSQETKVRPHVYFPYNYWTDTSFTFHIAVAGDSPALRNSIAAALRDVWPFRTVPELKSIQQQIEGSSAELTSAVRIILWVTGFATLITGFGFYFFSSYMASQTLKDAAIRIALGANSSHVVGAHLRRYRYGIIGGLVVGGALIASAKPLWGYLNLNAAGLNPLYLAIAVILLTSIAAIGLCIPLLKVVGMDIFLTLRNNAE